jgi:predicted Zn-dependent protease with MMP-like domain
MDRRATLAILDRLVVALLTEALCGLYQPFAVRSRSASAAGRVPRSIQHGRLGIDAAHLADEGAEDTF